MATRRVFRDGDLQFRGSSSSVVARMPPQTRNGRCQVAEQLLGKWNIRKHTILFKSSSSKKEREKEEDEQNQNFHAWFS